MKYVLMFLNIRLRAHRNKELWCYQIRDTEENIEKIKTFFANIDMFFPQIKEMDYGNKRVQVFELWHDDGRNGEYKRRLEKRMPRVQREDDSEAESES